MQLLGQPVRHNAFGTGVITGLSGNIITIDFAQGEKRFQYPDAFSRFRHPGEGSQSGGRSRRGIHRLLFERLLKGQAAYPQQAQAEFGVSADNSGDGL